MAGITSNTDISSALRKLEAAQENFKLEPNLKAIGLRMVKWIDDNFKSEGGLVGRWKALSEKTVERRRKGGNSKFPDTQILQDTGALKSSFDHYGGTGYKLGVSRVRVGSELIYAGTQNFGRDGIPERRILPNSEQAKEVAVKLIQARIDKLKASQNV